ncbi:hypothetical protein [Ideonella alba]|uniref:Uncharacterized protein n=1 Tax=Ideonella alba TaxID=2824118 RepID=A0A941BCJ2_9BURK|nr:hypothetical protein [Ideonella alba]MBQ0929206.1 hypothetical protein [Ideonella alba]
MTRPVLRAMTALAGVLLTLLSVGAHASTYRCSADGLTVSYEETGTPPTVRSLSVQPTGGLAVVYDESTITEAAVPMGRLLTVREAGSKRHDSLLIPRANFTDNAAYPFYGWWFVTSTNKASQTPLVENAKGRRLDCQAAAVGLFKLGGTVTAGTPWGGASLTNNGTDKLNLTADGAFAFAPRYPQGSSYNVAVTPGPNAQCNVSNGSGVVNGDVGNIGVSCECVAGFAGCNTSMCAFNLMSDPNNCGRCAFSCGPNHACIAGTCVGTLQRLLQ